MNERQLVALLLDAQSRGDREAELAARDLLRRLDAGEDLSIPRGEPPPPDVPGLDPMRQFAQGSAFGWADEIEAGQDALLGGDYEDSLEQIRQANAAYSDQHPWRSAALQMAGGAASSSPIAGATRQVLARAPAVVQMGAAGAVEGALMGAGVTPDDRAGGAGIGAAMGGALGVGMDRLGRSGLLPIPGEQARRAEQQALGGLTPQQAGAELDRLNAGFTHPWALGADVAPGPAQAAYAARPPNAQQFEDLLTARQRAQGPLLEQVTRDITGVTGSRTQAHQDLVAARRAEGRAMYDPLRAERVDVTPDMAETLRTPAGADAAQRTLQALRTTRRNPDLELGDVLGDFDFWHGYQQVLRDTGNNRLASAVPLSTPEAAATLQTRDDVMSDLFGQDWGPRYRQATERYRENSQLIDALGDSEQFMRLSRDQVRAAVRRLNDDEREVFAAGVVNDLIEKALRNPDTADIARKMVRTPALRTNLEEVLGEGRLAQLDNAMDRLSTMTATHNTVLRGSPTQPRQVQQEIIAGGQRGAMQHALNFQLGDAVAQILGTGGDRVLNERVAEVMLRIASAGSTDAIEAAVGELRDMGLGPAQIRAILSAQRMLGAGVTQAVPSLSPYDTERTPQPVLEIDPARAAQTRGEYVPGADPRFSGVTFQ